LLSVLTPVQMRHAYGVDGLVYSAGGQTTAVTGAGQKIGIVVAYHNQYLASEVANFDADYGLGDLALAQVNLAGSMANLGWAQEEAMDVEWVHAFAPGAAIVVVEAASDSTSDLMAAVNVARNIPSVTVVSMSWGGSEFRGQTGYDGIFTTPAGHLGITFVAASGDNGNSDPQWPATSPNVVAVGGTTLRVDPLGNDLGESAWPDTGGGLSKIEREPAYQAGVQHSGRRSTPDVAMDGDPNTGVGVFVVSPLTSQGSWQVFGGTSLSAQLFGGLIAIINQGRALAGKASLDGRSQTLPDLYAVAATGFLDVTSGSNGYHAARGYDLTSGLGTPKGAVLENEIVSGVIPPVVSATPSRRRSRPVTKIVARHPKAVVQPQLASLPAQTHLSGKIAQNGDFKVSLRVEHSNTHR
jgi:subtilase family serine protease